MTNQQQAAIRQHCWLGCETALPEFCHILPGRQASLVLSVNSGYECIEAGFGGPVWHASIAPIGGAKLSQTALRELALTALRGVGSVTRGQWMERTPNAFHVRRRLTEVEELLTGPAIDVRGTDEAAQRIAVVKQRAPHVPEWMLEAER